MHHQFLNSLEIANGSSATSACQRDCLRGVLVGRLVLFQRIQLRNGHFFKPFSYDSFFTQGDLFLAQFKGRDPLVMRWSPFFLIVDKFESALTHSIVVLLETFLGSY